MKKQQENNFTSIDFNSDIVFLPESGNYSRATASYPILPEVKIT